MRGLLDLPAIFSTVVLSVITLVFLLWLIAVIASALRITKRDLFALPPLHRS
jgi:hypothetical protein